jgi:rare lipoprotein A
MIYAGVRREAPKHAGFDCSFPQQSASPSMRLGALAAFCAALAGCSAHERGAVTAQAPATSEQAVAVALTTEATQQTAAGLVKAPTPVQPTSVQVAAASAGGAPVVVSAKPVQKAKIGRSGGGLASWYGDRFHGRPTANGERFDMTGFTAAHRSFPLPSYVRVTNVVNGRSIVVRVNDRGPFHANRVIDVSRRTADVLGFRHGGVGNVKLDLIGPAPEGRSDDRRLLASYQEFGHPTAAPGQQVAMAAVSDQDLANESLGYGGRAYQVASAAVTTSAAFVKSSATAVASTASKAATSATAAVASALLKYPAPKPANIQPVSAPTAVASAEPAPASPAAYAPASPVLASVPAAITNPVAGKPRVIAPAEPVLASSAPAVTAPSRPVQTASVDVSSRISASFDSFDAFATRSSR